MSKSGVIVLIIAAVVFLAVGFFVGQTASAVLNTPGSEDDPLVAQSYVESLVGERTAALQTQIDELKQLIEDLGAQQTTASADDNNSTSANNGSDSETDTDTDDTTTSETSKTVEITSQTVNIRSGPSTDTEKIASVYLGDKLEYIKSENDWYQVRLKNGDIGWVASWLTKLY